MVVVEEQLVVFMVLVDQVAATPLRAVLVQVEGDL
jgi:hypothetical protein